MFQLIGLPQFWGLVAPVMGQWWSLDTAFEHGIGLINAGSYYSAHDVLEEVWRGVHGWTKPFYQGMTQVAIALHHFSTGNLAGAQSVMAKSRKNLAEFPDSFCGVDLLDLMVQLE